MLEAGMIGIKALLELARQHAPRDVKPYTAKNVRTRAEAKLGRAKTLSVLVL